MRRLCRLMVAFAALIGFTSCGSTPNNDALVLDLQGFNDDGISQCDTVNPNLAEIDIIQDICNMQGESGDAEPFTETNANVVFQNNQKLDITIDSYSVKILDSGVGEITYSTSQTVQGKRCSNDATRACATAGDCVVGAEVGTCTASQSDVQVLLADFTTKDLIIPSVEPGGKTLDIQVTFFGTDVVGNDWQATGFIAGTFTDFNNCNCSVSQ